MSFDNFQFSDALTNRINQEGLTKVYPIQKEAIPAILKGKDVLGIAKTGSGKTLSYVLPILENLKSSTIKKSRHINVLVMVPTRELAVQVQSVFETFGQGLSYRFKSLAVYGGVSINPQMMAMQHVNVLVATPGRLIELASSNAVSLSAVEVFVLDEADKMLNLGFKEEMQQVYDLLPTRRQNLLFSATASEGVSAIRDFLLNEPTVVKIEEEEDELSLINQVGYFVADHLKGPLLRHLIKSKNLEQVLVFASSVYKADNVADKLRKNGIDAKAIHSKKSQQARLRTLADFKAGDLRVLVATDLLSRGIDIDLLPVVINYELPRSPKDFVHRIGRTGRAESQGEAITFVTPDDRHHFKVIQKKMKHWVTMIDADNIEIL